MSTIKSSDEHLTLNADGSGNDIKFQSNGSEVASISDGGVVTATSFAGSGANLTGISSVGGATGVDFNDNVKIRMGTGNDLEILHSGAQCNIDNATGNLLLTSAGIISLQKGSSEYLARFHPDGAAELYYDNSKKLETTSAGLEVQGKIEINSGFEFTAENGSTRMSIAHNTGNVWIDGNCSAASFTDRTPYPETLQLAYDVINSHKKLPDGQYKADDHSKQLDHSQLHEYVKAEDNNRNMSGVISCLVEVIKDLETRLTALES